METAFLAHPICREHEMIPGHPECPERLGAIREWLVAESLLDYLEQEEAPEATREQIERVHTPEHVEFIHSLRPESGLEVIDADTAANRATLEAALHAAGGAVRATEMVLGGEVDNAFCAVRPPGHHATSDTAMGFCFFNNVAVAAAHALEKGGLERVAIIDFDVHHGNGTEEIFKDDERVMFCSTYETGIFPLVAPYDRPGRFVSVGLRYGAGSDEFRGAVETQWTPAIDKFAPEMIFVSAGFDAHTCDAIADLEFLDDDYRWITKYLLDAAARHCKGRLVSALEGGYELGTLGRCAGMHIRELMGL